MVDGGEQLDVVAVRMEHGHEQLEVVRGHLRCQDGVAGFLHLLGELHARELGGDDSSTEGHHVSVVFLQPTIVAFPPWEERSFFLFLHFGERVETHLRQLFVDLVAQGGEQAAHADAGGAEVRDLVDLQDGVDLARRLEDLLHLVGGQGIQAAAEAVQLDEVEVLALGGNLGRRIQARVVHPLVDDADGALERAEVRDGIFREHRQAETGEQLGDGMVDLGVVVIRSARQHDAVSAGFLHPSKRFLALRAHVGFELGVFCPCRLDGLVDFRPRRARCMFANHLLEVVAQLVMEALFQVVFLVIRQPRVEERGRIGAAQLVDVQPQRLAVTGDYGAVVMVPGALVFLAFPFRAGHPDEIGILGHQVHDVAVGKLCRIADRLRRHRLDARLVGLLRRRVGQDDAVAELREEREPERVVLVHVQRARDAHRPARGVLGRSGS